jgi:sRNA-binding regulator protein Hfq
MAQLFPHAHASAGEVKDRTDGATPTAVDVPGPRKLVRPTLPPKGPGERSYSRREPSPVLSHQSLLAGMAPAQESNHAESFYFQKQVQTQTQMVFVLEDGEQIEGQIEWYDRNVIKVKQGPNRILIYKTGIKYLYKAGENHP